MVVKGDSSIKGDGFDISLVAVDGGMHFARRGEWHQGGIEGDSRGGSHDGIWEESGE